MLSPDWPFRRVAAHMIALFMEMIPAELRHLFPSESELTDEAERLWERGRARGSPSCVNPQQFMEGFLQHRLLEVLFDWRDPIGMRLLLDRSIDVAESILGSYERILRRRYGQIAEPGAARHLAWYALVELGRDIAQGRQIHNKMAWLHTIIHRSINRMIDAEMRTAAPGRRAFHQLVKRYCELLAEQQPELDEIARLELAERRASEDLARVFNFVERVGEEAEEGLRDESRRGDTHGRAMSGVLVALIDDLVRRPPFTDTDRDCWELLLAYDLDGRAIDWPRERGIGKGAGRQRLSSFLRKLRKALEGLWEV